MLAIVRYVVIGAGAVGGTIGGRMHEAGLDVLLVARGAHLDALRATGLRLEDPDRARTLTVPVAGSPAEVDWRDGDVAVLATKTQDTAAILDVLASVAPGVTIVCAQNGVANERFAAERFARVVGMCVMLPAEHLEPGVVVAQSGPVPGLLDIGLYPEGVDEVTERIAADLRQAGFVSDADPAIMRRKYRKLVNNLPNAIEATCGRADPEFAAIDAAAREEGERVLAAAGIDVLTEEDDRARRAGVLTMRPVGGRRRGGGSTWQSLRRGTGAVEADFLNGEIVELGRRHGVATPVNARLLEVVTEMALAGEEPATRAGADLLAGAR